MANREPISEHDLITRGMKVAISSLEAHGWRPVRPAPYTIYEIEFVVDDPSQLNFHNPVPTDILEKLNFSHPIHMKYAINFDEWSSAYGFVLNGNTTYFEDINAMAMPEEEEAFFNMLASAITGEFPPKNIHVKEYEER